MYQLLIKYTKTILWLLKAAIVTLAIYVIYSKVFELNKAISFKLLANFSLVQLAFIFMVLFFLSVLNWGLEIMKWNVLVSAIAAISFFEAAKQCLMAHTSALGTPFKIGEFGAKTLFFTHNNKLKILYLNLLGNASQLMMTVIFGGIGLFFYQHQVAMLFTPIAAISPISILSMVFIFSLLIVFFVIRNEFPFWRHINAAIHFKNLGIALLRYLLFSHQFMFLLYVIHPSLDYTAVIGAIFSMYLLAAIIPTVAIFDWSIKGAVAIFLLGFLGFQASDILMISLLLWLFNFAIPALIGSYFVVTFQTKKYFVHE